MKDYSIVEINESTLEDLIRHYSSKIEEGLLYVDHQVETDRGRRLDVLLVDSGGALTVAELKVLEDDGMLLQGIDYYDYIVRHQESICRTYSNSRIQVTEQPRLMLIAPSFSAAFLERCKWISIPISLFTFKCMKMDNEEEIFPVFTEIIRPGGPKQPVPKTSVEIVLDYITDCDIKTVAADLLADIDSWDSQNILLDPIQGWVSLKYRGKVFAYFAPRRKFFGFEIPNAEGNWPWITVHPENQETEIENVKELLHRSIDNIKG